MDALSIFVIGVIMSAFILVPNYYLAGLIVKNMDDGTWPTPEPGTQFEKVFFVFYGSLVTWPLIACVALALEQVGHIATGF